MDRFFSVISFVICVCCTPLAGAEILIKNIGQPWNPAMAKSLAHSIYDIESNSWIGHHIVSAIDAQDTYVAFAWGSIFDLVEICGLQQLDLDQNPLQRCYTEVDFNEKHHMPTVVLRKPNRHSDGGISDSTVFQGVFHIAQHSYDHYVQSYLDDNFLIADVEADLASLIEGYAGDLEKQYAKWPIFMQYADSIRFGWPWKQENEDALNKALFEIGQEKQKKYWQVTGQHVQALTTDAFVYLYSMVSRPQIQKTQPWKTVFFDPQWLSRSADITPALSNAYVIIKDIQGKIVARFYSSPARQDVSRKWYTNASKGTYIAQIYHLDRFPTGIKESKYQSIKLVISD
ncbi:MAG: hypothetical protein R3A45_00990 [Bdellovibrionota bacterium]